jgi:hypothetical protein
VSTTGAYNWFDMSFKPPVGGGSTGGGGVAAVGPGGFAIGEALGGLIKGISIIGILSAVAHYSGGGDSSSSSDSSGTAAQPPNDEDPDNWGDDGLQPGSAKSQVPSKQDLQNLRSEFNKNVKPKFWQDEAANSPGKYSQEDLARMKLGKAPIGDDGYPMDIHHETMLSRGGTNDPDNLIAMTRTQHRLGSNYAKNHPPLGK